MFQSSLHRSKVPLSTVPNASTMLPRFVVDMPALMHASPRPLLGDPNLQRDSSGVGNLSGTHLLSFAVPSHFARSAASSEFMKASMSRAAAGPGAKGRNAAAPAAAAPKNWRRLPVSTAASASAAPGRMRARTTIAAARIAQVCPILCYWRDVEGGRDVQWVFRATSRDFICRCVQRMYVVFRISTMLSISQNYKDCNLLISYTSMV
mmetsp:Transcript_24470/g.48742  ORF Transcript_24470/g.48742 Transcript_24470/m.48742 type:complete len:207 (+) Transcript_24470:224-844(+)